MKPANVKRPKAMTPWQADLLRAADLLEDDAELLRAGYTVRGDWPDTGEAHKRAHRDYDDLLALARRIRVGAVG